jgi:hypothetical protein
MVCCGAATLIVVGTVLAGLGIAVFSINGMKLPIKRCETIEGVLLTTFGLATATDWRCRFAILVTHMVWGGDETWAARFQDCSTCSNFFSTNEKEYVI